MKCRGCGEEKPDELFALRSDKGYRRRTCNDCMNQRQRQRQARYRADRRAWKERTKWGAKGGKAAAARGDWLRNMAPAAKTRYIRDANLKALYGIRLKEYEQLLEQQAGLCAICGRPPRSRRVLDVDHDHLTGIVRGLLCGNCNRAVGLLDDNPELFRQGQGLYSPISPITT
jgi:hypothetical protein